MLLLSDLTLFLIIVFLIIVLEINNYLTLNFVKLKILSDKKIVVLLFYLQIIKLTTFNSTLIKVNQQWFIDPLQQGNFLFN
jgi:hypothetical protein